MRQLLRKALESELVLASQAPEEDSMMQLFQQHFEKEGGVIYALEERADGKVGKEFEHTFYAKLEDMAELKKASGMEHQSQWEIKIPKTDENAGKGTIRVRATWVDGGDPTYVRTTKIPMDDSGEKKIEIPVQTNKDEFNAFQFLANVGMVKDRFHFPIVGTDLVWEIDCFSDGQGSYHPWVKIDLEVPDMEAPIPEFPIQFSEVILPERLHKGDMEERKKAISDLYTQYFLAKNPYRSGEKAQQQEETPVNTGETPAVTPSDTPTDQNQPDNNSDQNQSQDDGSQKTSPDDQTQNANSDDNQSQTSGQDDQQNKPE